MRLGRAGLALGLALAAWPATAREVPVEARPDPGLPSALREVGIDQRLGERLPLDLALVDQQGQAVRLGRYFEAGRPVVLAFAYYRCPMLCNQVLAGLARALEGTDLAPGRDIEVVVASFDPDDRPEQAAARQHSLGDVRWHFLTGSPAAIETLTAAAGFRYTHDAATGQFAHAAGIMLATPDGRLARYLYGIDYQPRDLRLALVEASELRIGGPVDRLLLYCYRYDPLTGRYGAAVLRLVRLAGAAGVIGLAALILVLRRSERRSRKARAAGAA